MKQFTVQELETIESLERALTSTHRRRSILAPPTEWLIVLAVLFLGPMVHALLNADYRVAAVTATLALIAAGFAQAYRIRVTRSGQEITRLEAKLKEFELVGTYSDSNDEVLLAPLNGESGYWLPPEKPKHSSRFTGRELSSLSQNREQLERFWYRQSMYLFLRNLARAQIVLFFLWAWYSLEHSNTVLSFICLFVTVLLMSDHRNRSRSLKSGKEYIDGAAGAIERLGLTPVYLEDSLQVVIKDANGGIINPDLLLPRTDTDETPGTAA